MHFWKQKGYRIGACEVVINPWRAYAARVTVVVFFILLQRTCHDPKSRKERMRQKRLHRLDNGLRNYPVFFICTYHYLLQKLKLVDSIPEPSFSNVYRSTVCQLYFKSEISPRID